MQIVIDIPEYIYNLCQGHGDIVYKYIAKGTPLPKGHGRLYDEKAIRKGIKNPYQCETVLDGLKLVKPIIEAEREG